MLEAVVAIALHAIVISVVLGAVLGALVYAVTRQLALTATTRHILWTTALLAIAAMPLAGIVQSALHPTRIAAPGSTPYHAIAPRTGGPHLAPPPSAASSHPNASVHAAPVAHHDALRPPTLRLTHALAIATVVTWGLGALIGLAGLAASVWRVRGLKRRSSPLDGALADELPWLTEVGPGREIYLRLSYETETPVAIGFRRPVILIPTELATHEGLAAIESLVMHEHAHLRRYDDWTNLVQRVVERLFWFNPVVWLIGTRIALEREIASDDAVVQRTGAAKEYATSLWRLAREMRMPEHAVVAPGALLTRKQISVRIEQLLDANRTRLRRSPAATLGVATAALLFVALVATSTPALELPVPPSPPVPLASSQPLAVDRAAPPHHVVHAPVIVVQETIPPPAPLATLATPVPVATAATPPPVPTTPAPARERRATVVVAPDKVMVHGGNPAAGLAAMATVAGAVAAGEAAGESQVQLGKRIHDVLAGMRKDVAVQAGDDARMGAQHDGIRVSRDMVASCTGCSFRGADLHGLDLHGISLTANDFRGANLRGVDLSGAQLSGDSLRDADLSGANLSGAQLSGVDWHGANLSNANLTGIKLIGVSLQHIELRGTTLRDAIGSCTGCDLSGLDLSGQDLHGLSLTSSNLAHADLRNANLSGASFRGVNLSHANLTGADLTNASVIGCNLSGVTLSNARTSGMILRGSMLYATGQEG
ncbi:MAG TPA: pentapeptide repeat-containing protein [Candidatus Acidoferrum sp.]|nr:pentapeptide repeat-containing protein [Candidatus Acidoferrum sp.]